MIGAAAIFFSGCTYQRKFDNAARDEVFKRAAEKNLHDFKELRSQYSDWDILFNQHAYEEFIRAKEQLVATFIRETSNGLLYDATGSIDVACQLDILDGSYHAGARVTYHPKLYGAIILERVFSPEDIHRPKKEKRSLSDLVQEGLLLPQPA